MKKNKPTSFDIAHLAGVSQPTVSRALRDSPLVSRETRRKVKKIAKELNYHVDVNARNLRSQSTNTIALLLCEDIDTGSGAINPFFLSMLGSITHAAARVGYDVLISFQQLSDDWNAEYEDANRADGIIFLGYGDYTNYIKKISRLDEVDAHFITWGPVIENQPGHFMGCNNIQGGYLFSKHLLDLGHRHIAFIGSNNDDSPELKDRYAGYVQAHQELGVDHIPELQVACDSSEDHSYEAVKQLLKKQSGIDALCCASDLIAIGAIKAIKELGHKVPYDIPVVGFDDIPTARHMAPALTTVRQDTALAGELLVDNLLKLINGEHIESTLLPTTLIIRESCGQNLKKT